MSPPPLSALIDKIFGSTRGSILIRSANGWIILPPGTATQVLTSNGAGADPSYQAGGGGGGGQAQIYPAFTAPVNANFSWVNQGGASVTVNANGGIFLNAPKNSGISGRFRVLTLPSSGTVAWTLTTCVLPFNVGPNFQFTGLVLRESATGKLSTLGVSSQLNAANAALQVVHWTSVTGRGGATLGGELVPITILWLRLQYDGTNLNYSYSIDGYNFNPFFSELPTAAFTTRPDQVGFFADDETNTFAACITLLSWNLTTP